jgi:hypothetical protein
MPSFSSLYTLSFLFKEKDLEMLDDIRVVIIREKKVEIYSNIIYNAFKSEIKRNETYKDYNALTGPIRIDVKGVFFYQYDRSLEIKEELLLTLNKS